MISNAKRHRGRDLGCRRFTRLTNAFSKKLANHKAAVALYVAHYNLCRVHETRALRRPMYLYYPGE